MRKRFLTLVIVLGLVLPPKFVAQEMFQDIASFHAREKKEGESIHLIFIHTDWCVYCQLMKKQYARSAELRHRLQENSSLRLWSLHAEDQRPISWGDKIFKYRPRGISVGRHALVDELLGSDFGNAYPVVIFVNEDGKVLYRHDGVLPVADLISLWDLLEKHHNAIDSRL